MDLGGHAPSPSPRAATDVPRARGYLPLAGHLVALARDLPGVMRSLDARRGLLQRVTLPAQWEVFLWASPDAFDLFRNEVTSSSHWDALTDVIFGHTSMLSADGQEHRHRRKASNRPFSPGGLTRSGVSAMISEVVEARVQRLMQHSEATMLDEAQIVALEIIFRAMGVPRDDLPSWAAHYNTLFESALGPRWDLPGMPYRRALRARAWIDGRLAGFVDAARRDPDATGLIAELVRGRDDEGQALSDSELYDNLRLMVFAGHETTASVIAWMVSYAATRPDIHDRLMAEAIAVDSLPQTAKAMRAVPFTEALFREVLRLHPPVVLTTRITLEPLEIEGYHLPPGTVVGIPLWLLGRHPDLFDDPERFDPDRWIRQQRAPTPIERSAFGGGPHFCLGYHMAVVEGVQYLVALMRGLHDTGRRLHMERLPKELYVPLLRPRKGDTRCAFRPNAGG